MIRVIENQFYIMTFDADNYTGGKRYVFAPYNILRFGEATYYLYLN